MWRSSMLYKPYMQTSPFWWHYFFLDQMICPHRLYLIFPVINFKILVCHTYSDVILNYLIFCKFHRMGLLYEEATSLWEQVVSFMLIFSLNLRHMPRILDVQVWCDKKTLGSARAVENDRYHMRKWGKTSAGCFKSSLKMGSVYRLYA